MSLSKDIFISNTFNVKSGKGMGTPGKYIVQYASRKDDTEQLFSSGMVYNLNYINELNLEEEFLSYKKVKTRLKKDRTYDNRAFSSKGITINSNDLIKSSNMIQKAFERGHSVQRIVISFSESYLRTKKVLDENFVSGFKGCYRGMVDNFKVRTAICSGMKKFLNTGNYSNPEWIGNLHYDTSSLHAHIVLIDKDLSVSRIINLEDYPNDLDRGKVYKIEVKSLRTGIDYEFNKLKRFEFLRSTSITEQNKFDLSIAYYNSIKINDMSRLQVLAKLLPKNKDLWFYNSIDDSMVKPNNFAKEFIKDLFEEKREFIGYDKVFSKLEKYVSYLDSDKKDFYIDLGLEEIYKVSVDSLYKEIKKIPDETFNISNKYIDVITSDELDLDEPLGMIEFKKRYYGSKKSDLKKKITTIKEDLSSSLDTSRTNVIGPDTTQINNFMSMDLLEDTLFFLRYELIYHMHLYDKYLYLYPNEIDDNEYNNLNARYSTFLIDFDFLDKDKDEEFEEYFEEFEEFLFESYFVGFYSFKDIKPFIDFKTRNIEDTSIIKNEFSKVISDLEPSLSNLNNLVEDDYFEDIKFLDLHDCKEIRTISDKYIYLFEEFYNERLSSYVSLEDNILNENIKSSVDMVSSDLSNMKKFIDSCNSYKDNTPLIDDTIKSKESNESNFMLDFNGLKIEKNKNIDISYESEKNEKTIPVNTNINYIKKIRKSFNSIDFEEVFDDIEL